MTGPLIVGIGGTTRPGSSTERALVLALRQTEAAGLVSSLLIFSERLPHFNPGPTGATRDQAELAQAVREADGVIVATPGYHGSLSGVVKNALDTLELTRADPRPYFQGRAVGVIITADGAQAGGTTLMAVRGIIHAMRGWPTPFGAALNATNLFDSEGECRDAKDLWQISTVADPGRRVAPDEVPPMKRPYLVPPGGSLTPDGTAFTSAISPIEDIIEDARNGRPYILVDAEDRENEGDVIIPARLRRPTRSTSWPSMPAA